MCVCVEHSINALSHFVNFSELFQQIINKWLIAVVATNVLFTEVSVSQLFKV